MISAVVLTKDSEKTIERCLKSLDWCDEMIIIDDDSTDKTLDIAQEYKAKIFKRSLDNDFAAQRNFGLDKAKENWVLFIDSDEEVSRELKTEILHILEPKSQSSAIAQNCDGILLKRKDYFLGKWLKHGETGSTKLLRLAKKGTGVWKRKVHEVWEIPAKLCQLKNPILHYPHPTIKEFLKDINTYSTLHAKVAFDEGERTNYINIILKPKFKFLVNYLLKGGFLDGTAGFVMAMMMSFHSFLTQAKLWQLQQKKTKTNS